MNLWYQRLIIFFAKVFGVLIGLIFLGYLLYYNLYFKQDALIKYVPKDAKAYVAFRITPDLSQNKLVSKYLAQVLDTANFPVVSWDQLNQLTGNNFSFAIIPDTSAQSSKLQYLMLFDFGSAKNIDQRYLNYFADQGWHYNVFINQTKNRKILAVTSSQELLNQVKDVGIKNQASFAQNVSIVLDLKKFASKEYWGKAYCDIAFFSDQIPSGEDIKIKLALTAIKSQNFEPLILGIRNQGDKVIVQNNLDSSSLETLSPIISKLPDNLEYSLSFTDLPGKWKSMTNWLQKNDSGNYAQLLKNKQYLEGVYAFSWENDLLPVLNQQIQIIKTVDDQFLLSAKVTNNDLDRLTKQIESIIKNYLANSNPVVKKKQLPDYTYITQIVRETTDLKFTEEQVSGLKIRLLTYDNQEFAYILSNNSIILANSRDVIYDNLQNDQILQNWQDTGTIYNFVPNFSHNVYFSQTILSKISPWFEPISYMLISEDKFGDNLRLILE